jgi:glycosyltransferase involved in cell wall biosynthesis
MEDSLLLTVITPVYNAENFIKETIDSVLNAKIDLPFEYLVINDGSKDETLQILETYGTTITLLTHENIGESLTVNRGLEAAKGKYILVLSADDPLLTSDLIYQAVAKLEGDPSLVAIYPDWKVINQFGETIRTHILPDYSDEIMIGYCRCIPGPGTIFRRDSALRIGGRREEWKFVGDYDFWLRLSRYGRIERLPGVLAQWRNNQGSASISQRGVLMASERINVIEDFLSRYHLPKQLSRKALGNSNYIAARLAFFDPDIPGRKLLIQAFKSRRGWPEEAKLHIILFLLLLPVSSKLIDRFPRIKRKILSR